MTDTNDSVGERVGLVILGISRGCAVALFALALYVALTNWEGDGGVWAVRYFGIALAIYAVGLAVRYSLRRK